MPIQKCTKNGQSGHQFGDSGTCYTGPNSKKRAARQGRAIKAQQNTSNSGAYRGVGEKTVKNRNKLKDMMKRTQMGAD